jgi:hypothetical protein
MLGTKELLARQKQERAPAPPLQIEIAPVESCLTLKWSIPQIADHLGIEEEAVWKMLYKPGVILDLLAAWLAKEGFSVESEGRRDYVATSLNNTARYRLRLAVYHIEYAPPSDAQSGWLSLFQCDLLKAPLYFISNNFVEQMCSKVNGPATTDRYKLKSQPARDYIRAALERTRKQ